MDSEDEFMNELDEMLNDEEEGEIVVDIETLPARRTRSLRDMLKQLTTMFNDGDIVLGELEEGIGDETPTEATRIVRFRGRYFEVTLVGGTAPVVIHALDMSVSFTHDMDRSANVASVTFEGKTSVFDFNAEEIYSLEALFRIVKISGASTLFVQDGYLFDSFNRFDTTDDARLHFCLPLWCVRDIFKRDPLWMYMRGVMDNRDALRDLRRLLSIHIETALEYEPLDMPLFAREVMRDALSPHPHFGEELKWIRDFVLVAENISTELQSEIKYQNATLGSLVAVTLSAPSMDAYRGDLMRTLILGDIYNNLLFETVVFDMWDEEKHIGGDHVG